MRLRLLACDDVLLLNCMQNHAKMEIGRHLYVVPLFKFTHYHINTCIGDLSNLLKKGAVTWLTCSKCGRKSRSGSNG